METTETTITKGNKPNDFENLNSEKSGVHGSLSLFNTDWKFNIVNDLSKPELYSRKAIYFFTIICSIFFGGALMFINLRRLKNIQGQIVVATYSILYGVISGTILAQFERSTILTLIVSMIGSFALYNFFWKKYIGINTEYRPKSILVPFIIALVFLAFFALFVVINIEAF